MVSALKPNLIMTTDELKSQSDIMLAQLWHNVPTAEKASAIAEAFRNNPTLLDGSYKVAAITNAWENRREKLPQLLSMSLGTLDPSDVATELGGKLKGIFSQEGRKELADAFKTAVLGHNWLKWVKSRTDLRWEYLMQICTNSPGLFVSWFNKDLHEFTKFIELCGRDKAIELLVASQK